MVEDDKLVRDALLDTLTDEGYEVQYAPDGPEALVIIRKEDFFEKGKDK